MRINLSHCLKQETPRYFDNNILSILQLSLKHEIKINNSSTLKDGMEIYNIEN